MTTGTLLNAPLANAACGDTGSTPGSITLLQVPACCWALRMSDAGLCRRQATTAAPSPESQPSAATKAASACCALAVEVAAQVPPLSITALLNSPAASGEASSAHTDPAPAD